MRLFTIGTLCLLWGCQSATCGDELELNEDLDRCVCPGTTTPPRDDGGCAVLDAGTDAPSDAGVDAEDAPTDAAADVAPDIPLDVPPTCDSATTLCGVTSLCGGGAYNCALLESGQVYCWGDNRDGLVGPIEDLGETVSVPTRIRAISGSPLIVDELSCGDTHVCARTADDVLCWGDGLAGQIGNGATDEVNDTPSFVLNRPALETVRLHDANQGTCAAFGDGTKWCWGGNNQRQLGAGPPAGILREMTRAPELDTADEIAGGYDFICQRRGSEVRCAGANTEGQLGDGTNDPSPVTVRVDIEASAIGSGGFATCAIAGDEVRCWGANFNGQLGSGPGASSNAPVAVAIPEGATDLFAGLNHVCARVAEQLWCWGENDNGQLGDGSDTERVGPVLVSAVEAEEITHLTLGWEHTCGLLINGSVVCWGKGERGELGNGSTLDSTSAVRVVAPPG